MFFLSFGKVGVACMPRNVPGLFFDEVEVSTDYLWMDNPAITSYRISPTEFQPFFICRAQTKNYKLQGVMKMEQ